MAVVQWDQFESQDFQTSAIYIMIFKEITGTVSHVWFLQLAP